MIITECDRIPRVLRREPAPNAESARLLTRLFRPVAEC
jgi:hypothetical protein